MSSIRFAQRAPENSPRRAPATLDPETSCHEDAATPSKRLRTTSSHYSSGYERLLLATPVMPREASSSRPLTGKRTPSTTFSSNIFTREQLQRIVLSGASTVDTPPPDPLRTALLQGKEFVPTAHLGSDSFPQFPSVRQSPSTPLFIAERISTDEPDDRPPPQPRERVALSDVAEKLYLLIRAVLFQYKYFWLSLITLIIGLPWIFCFSRYIITLTILYFLWPSLWNTMKALFISIFPSIPSTPFQPSTSSTTSHKQRLRDLPQYQPSKSPDILPIVQQPQVVPPFLRWCPVGNFGEMDFTMPSFKLAKPTLPPALIQKKFKKGVSLQDATALERQETTRMVQKLGHFVTDLCHRLLLTEAQDATLSSALSQLGLHYVVEHPLAAFYSLPLNDNRIVNLNDRHLPQTLINLCNSYQQNERQIAEQLLQLLIQRRQLEKYLMIVSDDQRVACLRRLARWSYGGLEKEYSPYYTSLTNPLMTDGDLLHHLLFTWLAQQLPSLRTDVFSRTHLALQPTQATPTLSGSRTYSLSSTILSIQKFPTEMPSGPGTFYKITQLTPPSTKAKITEVSWDDLGVIEGIARFLVLMRNSRPDVVTQMGSELCHLLED